MKTSYVAGLSLRTALAVLAAGSLFLAGCSNSMTPVESVGGVTPSVAKISGKIHGGNQPVSGALVTLYRAGQMSFASGAVALAHTTSAADGYGSFSFSFSSSSTNSNNDNTYNCTETGASNPYLFLVARSGTTVNTAGAMPNPDSAFIAPLGRCDSVSASTFVNMSEVVTVATMAAMHQFMNPSVTGGIETSAGADGTYASDLALGNALYNVSNMVNLTTGFGNASLTKGGQLSGTAGVSVTITPELSKIDQLANAISSCINYSGSGNPNCSTLYANAAPPASSSTTSVPGASMPAATDILSALYYIFTNPTNGGTSSMQAIYNLSSGTGAPYQPTLSAMPTDWTIGVAFTSTGTCSDVSASTAGFINTPYSLDLDQYGNVLIGNNQSGAGSLAALDAFGAPLNCTTLTATSGTANGSKSTAVDTAGNVYSGLANSGDLYRFNPSTPGVAATHYVTPDNVLAMAADGSGNVFFSTINGKLYEIPGAATATTFTYTQISSSLDATGNATNLIVDTLGRIWASGNAGTGTVTYPDSSSSTGYTTTVLTSNLNHRVVTVGKHFGNMSTVLYDADYNVGSVEYTAFSDSGNGVVPASTSNSLHTGGGLTHPTGLAVDGAQNVWISNATGSAVSGFSLTGTAMAPSGYVKDPSYLGAEQAISVDGSGNIWIAAGTNTITEIVGSAVPVAKSYAFALQGGRFQQLP